MDWENQIWNARQQYEDPVIRNAVHLRELYAEGNIHIGNFRELVEEEAYKISKTASAQYVQAFKDIAFGDQNPLRSYLKRWRAHQEERGLKQKTLDGMQTDLDLVCSIIPTIKFAEQPTVEKLVGAIEEHLQKSPSRINRILSSCRNFFAFLKYIKAVATTEPDPFITPPQYKKSNKRNAKTTYKTVPWLAFSTKDVTILHGQAMKNKDPQLAHLITIAAYTGARIEEICSL